MRRVAALAFAFALLGAGCSLSDDDEQAAAGGTAATAVDTDVDFGDVPAIVEAASPSVVTVFVAGPQGEGAGSGVIWDREGRIVTNNHVVAGASEVEVAIASGVRLEGRVVGTDPRTDLAIVDVDRNDLPAAGSPKASRASASSRSRSEARSGSRTARRPGSSRRSIATCRREERRRR